MDLTLLKQVNESIINQTAFFEAVDAITPDENFLATTPQVLVETAEAALGKAFAQLGAGKNLSDEDANLVMGLYSLGDPGSKDKTLQQVLALRKGGLPLLVALQLAGDDAQVTNILRDAGKAYVQASGNGTPYQLQTMMLHGNVLDQNQRAALTQRLQRAQSAFRNAAAAMQAQQGQGQQGQQKSAQGPSTPAPKTMGTSTGNAPGPVRPLNLAGGSGMQQGAAAPGM
jgi:hypothetical protein